MRLLIFLLALSSAFFVPFSYSIDYIDSDYVPADSKPEFKHYCFNNGTFIGLMDKEACKALGLAEKPSDEYYGWHEFDKGNGRTSWEGFCDCGFGGTTINYVTYHYFETQEVISDDLVCPPEANPDYKIGPVHKPNEDTSQPARWCLPNAPNRCPAPTDNDPFVFGTGGQTEKCFKNSDGTQCKIQTDDTGGYYIPISYGSAEPVQCARPADKEVDKTSPPDDKPAPEETDDTPEMAELDALNKINDNLDAMNENQVAASDSNDERLDRVSEEIQIGNEILGEIRYNTDLIESNTDDTNGLLGETNALLADILDNTGGPPDDGEPCTGEDCLDDDLLQQIADNTKKEMFDVETTRKDPNKGLNSVFTDADIAELQQEIEDKKTEYADYIEQIQDEINGLMTFEITVNGGYEDRNVTLKVASKPVDVDMGLERISNFFKLIAPAILLLATLTAIYILIKD
ncbi:MAG: coiled-coil domain-containing protein [Pseudoalteromonas prydzensis]|uniref:coiled-coil domain-containing protein n=1 Tax=Pseudoalteromonas prydzensis TaxID=182141 RepID=UPI003F95E84F